MLTAGSRPRIRKMLWIFVVAATTTKRWKQVRRRRAKTGQVTGIFCRYRRRYWQRFCIICPVETCWNWWVRGFLGEKRWLFDVLIIFFESGGRWWCFGCWYDGGKCWWGVYVICTFGIIHCPPQKQRGKKGRSKRKTKPQQPKTTASRPKRVRRKGKPKTDDGPQPKKRDPESII